MYDYLEISKAPSNISLDSPPTPTYPSQLDPLIERYSFTTPYTSYQFHYPYTSSHANSTASDWATISHQQLTIDPNIAKLTRKYCDACQRIGHLADAFWKHGLPFLSPQLFQNMHQYNLKHGLDTKIPP